MRRAGGVVVIIGVCLVLAVTSASGRLRVGGSARPPASAVLAGACVGPIAEPFDAPVTPGAGEGEQLWYTATYAFPVALVEDCARPHAGEVLSVDYSVTSPNAATLPQFDGWDAACQVQADALLMARGFGNWQDRWDGATVVWGPAFTLAGRVFGPDAAARAAGERWSACALTSPVRDLGEDVDGPLPGRCFSVGTVRAFNSDTPTGAHSIDDPEIAADCSTPHQAQVVAVASMIGGRPAPDELRRSCGRAAAHFLKVPDPGFGGAIDLAFVQDYSLGVCLATVAGPGKLDGSLLGIGAAPLPWVG